MKLNKKKKIFLAGHKGMVGSAIYRQLVKEGYKNIITIDKKKLDLTSQNKTLNFLKKKKPYLVIIAAAKVGGIIENSFNKDKFLYENLQIQNNLIQGSYLTGVKNLILLGSSCVFPKYCRQPIKEEYLLTGSLEESNDAYAIAKIAGIKMCEYYSKKYNLNFKALMPPNLYGPNDNYDLISSHFYPALLKKIFIAKKNNYQDLIIWGSGKPKRELMFVEDFAKALIYFMSIRIKEPFINIGTEKDYSIEWYAKFLMKKLNVKLNIKYDKSKPDGTPKKLLDITKAKKYGWKPQNDLDKGFHITFNHFLKQENINKLI